MVRRRTTAIGLFLALLPRLAGAWSLAGGNIGGWTSHTLTVQYNASSCAITEEQLVALIDQAVQVWNANPLTHVTLTRNGTASTDTASDYLAGHATGVPLVVCDLSFQTDNDVDPNVVPAATRVGVSGSGNVNTAAVMINAQLGSRAEFSQLSSAQQLVAITHELGHVLGLGHSSNPHALMFYSLGDKTQPVLTTDDSDGLAFLYPRSEFSAGPFGCSAVHGTRSPASLPVAALFLVILFSLGRVFTLGMRRRSVL